MTSNYTFNFSVYENEPLMLLITKIKTITPIKLGLTFLFIGLSLLVVALLSDDLANLANRKRTFLLNTSWSFAIVFLYPFIVGLTLKYYQEIPRVYEYIFNNLLKEDIPDKDFRDITQHISKAFNNYFIFPITLIITLCLNYIYSVDILNNPDIEGWMVSNGAFTSVGLYATAIQVILVYWVMNLLLRGVIFSWSLHYLFNKDISYNLNPLHHDSCFGLKIIGEASMIMNSILFMLGIYISLKVIDKTITQGLSIFSDIANPVMLISFAILAPVLFFFPLGAAHHRMKKSKDFFLKDISNEITQLHTTLLGLKDEQRRVEYAGSINEMIKYSDSMKARISVWPFNFKSVEAFFAVIVVPLLPILFSSLMELNR